MQPTHNQLTPLTTEQIRNQAPSIFTTVPHSRTSESYQFIPTYKILEAMTNEGFLPVRAQQTRTRLAQRKATTRHMIRFRHQSYTNNSPTHSRSSSEFPEIVLVNSHDGSSTYQLFAGIFRLVCANGLIISTSQTSPPIRIRHNQSSNRTTQTIIDASYTIIKESVTRFEQISNLKSILLPLPAQKSFAKQALQLKGEHSAQIFDSEQFLAARRVQDLQNPNTLSRDLWTTFNTVQENLMRGGISGTTANNRRATSRAIRSVNEELRVNQALWSLAEDFATKYA